MRRPHFHAARCKLCHVDGSQVGGISATGLCIECGDRRRVENFVAMKTGRGPYAQWWAYKMAASVGYAPLDGAPDRP